MNKPTFQDIADLYSKLAVRYAELSNAVSIIEEKTAELDKAKEQYSILEQRFNSLVEQNSLTKQLLSSKENYLKELEAEIEMLEENRAFLSRANSEDKDRLISNLQNELDNTYATINLNILIEHCEYLDQLEKDSHPFAFEEIKQYLQLLIDLKEDYDQRQENTRNENLHEF